MKVTTTVKCPNCSADVPEENKFCDSCGTKMHARAHVRLADIDAPESYESGNERSTSALSSRILGKTVYLDSDGYSGSRLVCVVYVASGSRYKNVNYKLASGGYADYDPHDNAFDQSTWTLYESIVVTSGAEDNRDSDSDDPPSPEEEIPSWAVYIGSKKSDKYHKFTCYWASQINSENKEFFSLKADAESKGYVACKVCKP
jgi:hypothetical protein